MLKFNPLIRSWFDIAWGATTDIHNLWFFIDDTALSTAHPTASDWDFAVVWSTDTIRVRDWDTTARVDSWVSTWWETFKEYTPNTLYDVNDRIAINDRYYTNIALHTSNDWLYQLSWWWDNWAPTYWPLVISNVTATTFEVNSALHTYPDFSIDAWDDNFSAYYDATSVIWVDYNVTDLWWWQYRYELITPIWELPDLTSPNNYISVLWDYGVDVQLSFVNDAFYWTSFWTVTPREQSITYQVNDLVLENWQTYQCNTAHTSTLLFSDFESYWNILWVQPSPNRVFDISTWVTSDTVWAVDNTAPRYDSYIIHVNNNYILNFAGSFAEWHKIVIECLANAFNVEFTGSFVLDWKWVASYIDTPRAVATYYEFTYFSWSWNMVKLSQSRQVITELVTPAATSSASLLWLYTPVGWWVIATYIFSPETTLDFNVLLDWAVIQDGSIFRYISTNCSTNDTTINTTLVAWLSFQFSNGTNDTTYFFDTSDELKVLEFVKMWNLMVQTLPVHIPTWWFKQIFIANDTVANLAWSVSDNPFNSTEATDWSYPLGNTVTSFDINYTDWVLHDWDTFHIFTWTNWITPLITVANSGQSFVHADWRYSNAPIRARTNAIYSFKYINWIIVEMPSQNGFTDWGIQGSSAFYFDAQQFNQENFLVVNASLYATDGTIELPNTASLYLIAWKRAIIKRIDNEAYTVTINVNGSNGETIDWVTSKIISPMQSLTILLSTDWNWYLI